LAPAPWAADWPQWRYDAGRTAACPGRLSDQLHLQWVREYPALEPAWEDPVNQDRMPFDRVYEPVVTGRTLVFGSSRTDRVTALDTRTGEETWRYYTGGPVRLPPVTWQGKVYAASDDGYLYCLDAQTGALVWKFRGGPDGRKVLGNGRLVSAWPARGGPVVKDGVVYFAASIWPFMGVFIHALDADSGGVVWTNDGVGSTYMDQPHAGAVAFGSVAPQGAFAITGDRLIVPGGRSVPACLDRRTGKVLYYHLSGSKYHEFRADADRKREGGSHVSAIGKFFLNHRGLNTSLYDAETGEMYIMWKSTTYPVLTETALYLSGCPVVAYDLKSLNLVTYHRDEKDRKSRIVRTARRHRWEMDTLWECPVDGTGALAKVGDTLYAGGQNAVSALDLSASGAPRVRWQAAIDGTAARIIAADERLFVVTLEGRIYAFGPDEAQPKTHRVVVTEASPPDAASENLAAEMMASVTINKGYCLMFGLGDGRLAETLARNAPLRVIGVDPDAEKVAALRRRFDDAGLYGTRISLHVGDATTFRAPPYLAALTVSENLKAAGLDQGEAFVKAVYHSMRPYGGVAWLPTADRGDRDSVAATVGSAQLAQATVSTPGRHTLLRREGPLPGSDHWTHLYGNAANTAKSDDKLVKLPLGLLWFGGNSHHDVLPRHAHGPSEQVIGGRLFIQGINMLSARDVYTGQVLWKRTFPDLGTFGVYYDETYVDDPLDTTYNQGHLPGANARGTNYVVTADRIYLAAGSECLVLDPATGKTLTTFSLPAEPGDTEKPAWGYIGVYEDLLIGGARFARYSEDREVEPTPWQNFDTASSQKLVVMNRHSGQVLWTLDSQHGFRHSAIAAGAGRLYCIDSLPHPVLYRLILRGKVPKAKPVLWALNARTGKPVWQKTENVFGTWLGYSEAHDILIQGGRKSSDMVAGEPTERIIAHRGADGDIVWDRDIEYAGPSMIHGNTLYLNANVERRVGAALDLLTGEARMRKHPLTGQEIPWRYHRAYGCNSVIASEHLLTFRSGAAGYYDLVGNSGTGNLGGFKSGCTSNLIAADGVLNAPDYTRTCTCSYQNQTSLALVHMPDVEVWTCSAFSTEPPNGTGNGFAAWPPARITRVGMNFGAPGDRMASDGTLWVEVPRVGGPSPELRVDLEPSRRAEGRALPRTVFAGQSFRFHSSRILHGQLKWVAASGLIGVTRVTVSLADYVIAERPYTVRLHFAEPEPLAEGQRVFDVSLQGGTVLENFDIVKAAGGHRREVVMEFKSISLLQTLDLKLKAKVGQPVLCGLELVAEDR